MSQVSKTQPSDSKKSPSNNENKSNMSGTMKFLAGTASGAIAVGLAWIIATNVAAKNDVVARVGGVPITKTTFEKQMELYSGNQVMQQVIVQQLVANAAQKYNITATQQDINKALASFKAQQQITSDDQLNQLLAANHVSMAQLQSELKSQVLEQKLAERNVTVTDKQIQDYYNKNKASFTSAETVTASHILVKTQAEANHIEDLLKQGKSFASLAKQYSIDTGSKDQGGSLGTFGKGQMVPAFEKAAFALKPGQISAPVHTQYGWHIIHVTAHQAAVLSPLSKVKSQIIDTLKQQGATPVTTLIANLAQQGNVEILDPAYSSVVSQLENPQPSMPGQ